MSSRRNRNAPRPTFPGTITGLDGRYFIVASPDAPAHLRTHYLLPSLIVRDHAKHPTVHIGDTGTMEYRETPHTCLWHLVLNPSI